MSQIVEKFPISQKFMDPDPEADKDGKILILNYFKI